MGLFILLASFSSANAAPLEAFRTLTSEEYEYGSGASPCDVDADGYDDLVVGASGWGFGGAGAVYVHMGGPDGPAGAGELLVSGETDQTLGIAVACPGDVDRDGYEDVAVADAPEAGAYEYEGTRVHIHHGGPAGLSA